MVLVVGPGSDSIVVVDVDVVVAEVVHIVDLSENPHSPTSLLSQDRDREIDVSASTYPSLDSTSTEPSAAAAITLDPDLSALFSQFRTLISVLFGVISVDLLRR